MKKLIIIVLILKSSLTISQNFNDKILTKTGDTITCKITLINGSNIFYNLKVKKNILNEYIPQSQATGWIIDKDNKPEIISDQKGDSIIALTNTSCHNSNVLVARRVKIKNGQQDTLQVVFETGKRLYIKRYSNDTLLKGVFEYVSDSSLLINGKFINLTDIRVINKHRAGDVLITGLSVLAFSSVALLIGRHIIYPIKYDEYGDDINGWNYFGFGITVILIDFLDLITVVPLGIIKLATTRHFGHDKEWELKIIKEKKN